MERGVSQITTGEGGEADSTDSGSWEIVVSSENENFRLKKSNAGFSHYIGIQKMQIAKNANFAQISICICCSPIQHAVHTEAGQVPERSARFSSWDQSFF